MGTGRVDGAGARLPARGAWLRPGGGAGAERRPALGTDRLLALGGGRWLRLLGGVAVGRPTEPDDRLVEGTGRDLADGSLRDLVDGVLRDRTDGALRERVDGALRERVDGTLRGPAEGTARLLVDGVDRCWPASGALRADPGRWFLAGVPRVVGTASLLPGITLVGRRCSLASARGVDVVPLRVGRVRTSGGGAGELLRAGRALRCDLAVGSSLYPVRGEGAVPTGGAGATGWLREG